MNPLLDVSGTRELARRVRRHALRMVHRVDASHIGTCLSMADLLAVLYGHVLQIDPRQPDAPRRDRFVLSKGHGAAAMYAVLAESGFFPVAELESYCVEGSRLTGHVHHAAPGVDWSTGALGHGLSLAVGCALAGRRSSGAGAHGFRSFAILSDGECDEGSIWEAALFASHHQLDNLTAIVDYNKIQSFGSVAEVLQLEPFADKWRAFGWHVREVDGHDHEALHQVMAELPFADGKPSLLLAHTIKGKGVDYMEGQLAWHYRSPNEELLARALLQLGVDDDGVDDDGGAR